MKNDLSVTILSLVPGMTEWALYHVLVKALLLYGLLAPHCTMFVQSSLFCIFQTMKLLSQ